GNGAFYNCGFYGTLFIPDGVEKIEDWTFCNNDYDTFDTIIFPSTIKSIGEFSFVGADTIVCHAENPPIGLELIGRKNYTSPLYVPWESIDLYEGIEGLGWPVYDCPYEYYSIGDLNDTHIHLNVGESVYASLVYGTEVEIETPDAKVVSVRANKVITGIAPGTQAMSAIDGNGTYIDFYVHVYSVEAESIDINISEAQLKASETLQLSATVYPDNTTDKTIEWVSSNESVATVTESGLVTAVSVGQTVITAICGSVQTTCTISVVPTLATAILLDRDAVSATLGEEFQLIATVLPVETTDKRVAWSSSNESVATVDTEGLVKIINTGLCVITAATTDGSDLKAECVISPTTGINTMPQDCVGTDIYSPTGLLLHKGATDYELRNLASGIYIVKTGNDIRKIVVK
ncbi:MAG: Ig-like domain-containing protein, partial [Muribaculum sp.]|nr:Ig-like domain-containing protein [Muribaculum sp.]